MKRREFIGMAGGAAAWLVAQGGRAQSANRRIGVLINADPNDGQWKRELSALQVEMRRLGWIEGTNLAIDYRNGAGEANRINAAARELIAQRPDVIVARSTPVARALAEETQTIPIVFVSVSDPLGERFAASIAKPGGNMTGFTNVEASMGSKWVELLKEAVSGINRVAILFNPTVAPARGEFYLNSIRSSARELQVVAQPIPVSTPAEIEAGIIGFAPDRQSGLIVMPDPFIVPNRALVISLAARYQLPAIYAFRNMATEGGLISYGADLVDMLRRSAGYVDRILKGERAGDLPVQAPEKFDLVVNLKTAKAMQLAISESFLVRADEVIE